MEAGTYRVVIEPAEEGGYWAHVPALPGCFTQGSTLEEVVAMAREAIEGFVEILIKLGKPIPGNNSDCGRVTLKSERIDKRDK